MVWYSMVLYGIVWFIMVLYGNGTVLFQLGAFRMQSQAEHSPCENSVHFDTIYIFLTLKVSDYGALHDVKLFFWTLPIV
jgi:hypothetical protein